MTKRPWTQGVLTVEKVDNVWYVVAGTNPIASFEYEADARLFVSASAMYDVLEQHYTVGKRVGSSYCGARKVDRLHEYTISALRAANPDAFETTPTVPASQPEGKTK